MAYESDDVEGGPNWLDSDEFDVNARAEETSIVTRAELLYMLQMLLKDRFKLQVHHDTREVSSYLLVVAKGGPLFAEVQQGSSRGLATRAGRMLGQASMREVANALALLLRRPVLDNTGLNGWFSISLQWTPDVASGTASVRPNTNGPSLFTALQQQLGLQLEPKTESINIVIIDSVQKPSEN